MSKSCMRFCMRMDRQPHPKESEALILNALKDFPNQPLQRTTACHRSCNRREAQERDHPDPSTLRHTQRLQTGIKMIPLLRVGTLVSARQRLFLL